MPAMGQALTDRIGFIGGGHMARALIAGLLRQGVPPGHICVGEPAAPVRAALARDFNVAVSPDNAAAVGGAAVVVLAVKPQDTRSALRDLQGRVRADAVLLSIAAGVPIEMLAQVCALPIVRAMPNRAALLGAAITGLFARPGVGAPERARAERIGAAAGRTVWVRSEPELDLLTALSGSGPAYFILLAEQLAQAAAALGLAADTAAMLAVETLHGTGLLARHAVAAAVAAADCGAGTDAPDAGAIGRALAEERRAVTSRGGTTEAALRVLAEGGFDALIARALQAAAARAAQIACAPAPPTAARAPGQDGP